MKSWAEVVQSAVSAAHLTTSKEIVSSNSLAAPITPTHLATRSSGITIPSVVPHKIKQKHKKDANIPSHPQVPTSANPWTKTDTDYNDIHFKIHSHESNTSNVLLPTCSLNPQTNIPPMPQAHTPMGAYPSLELPCEHSTST